MEKLLKDGRTDVLRAFVSNRTRRKFSAFLARKPDGTVGFEFEPRTKPPRAKSAEPAPTEAKGGGPGSKRATKAAAQVEPLTAKKAAKAPPRKAAKSAPKRVAKASKGAKSARR